MDKESQFKAIWQANRDRIYRVCCGYVRDEDVRQDLFQTVLLHVWESLETYRGDSQVGTWVFRITVNTCLGYLRTRRRQQNLWTQRGEDAGRVGNGLAPCPTEVCGMRDDLERLYICIHQLPPVERMLISLHLEEMGTEEMADVLGLSPDHVRVKIHRVKNVLRGIWERTGDGME